jgi:hypothetical protein
MSPKSKSELAREHLNRALSAITADDYTEAVTWLFASLEAAVVAIADRQGIDTEKKHWIKAEVAERLFKEKHVPADYSELLDLLNNSRKEAVYEGEEPDLGESSLEDIAVDVEAAVEYAEGEGAE